VIGPARWIIAGNDIATEIRRRQYAGGYRRAARVYDAATCQNATRHAARRAQRGGARRSTGVAISVQFAGRMGTLARRNRRTRGITDPQISHLYLRMKNLAELDDTRVAIGE